MAEEALKKLEDQLNCSICLDTYTDPKKLQCNHVYCRQCLVPLVVRDQQGQLGLTCPTCRQITPIPDRGVAGLPSAFHVNYLLEIRYSFQNIQSPSATPSAVMQSCSEHVREELKLYCETCSEMVCWKCVIKDGKHHNHEYEELSQAFENYKGEITSTLEPMEKQIAAMRRVLTKIGARCGEIFNQREGIEENIHVTFRRLREVLYVRETELIGQVNRLTQSKLKGLAAQRDQIETTLAQRNSCLLFMKESLRTGRKEDVLMHMKPSTLEKVRKLATPLQPNILEPNTEADLVFSALGKFAALCRNYGQVLLAKQLLDPSKCHAAGKGVEVAVVGEKSTATVHAINFDGKPCEEPMKSLECERVSQITGARASCSVERRGQSQYEISYQPTIKGRHQLHIKAEGQHIRGSPFSVAVKSPVEKLGTPILTIGWVRGPLGVAISKKGDVVVTECDGNCISVFSPGGEKLQSFGLCGSNPGQLQGPVGVAVDGEGNILVADRGNHRIQKFTAEGQFLTAVGIKGKGLLQFNSPVDVAFNTSNNFVYVSDECNHRVQVLNSDLTFSNSFGKKGSCKGRFNRPCGVACDSTGKVYVADSYNHRIQVFTAKGIFLSGIGEHGQGRGELDMPLCVAIDTSDSVYVSECNNHRISVFTSGGQFLTSFGRRGMGPGEFYWPSGVAVDRNGVVYVCDSVINGVKVF